MKVAKVHPEGYSWMAFDADGEIDEILKTLKNLISESTEEERFIIEIVEMSEEEFASLPEFPGW